MWEVQNEETSGALPPSRARREPRTSCVLYTYTRGVVARGARGGYSLIILRFLIQS